MGVGEQDEIDGWQIPEAQTAAFDSFQQEKPIGEIWIHQHVQVVELKQEGGVTNPRDRDLASF